MAFLIKSNDTGPTTGLCLENCMVRQRIYLAIALSIWLMYAFLKFSSIAPSLGTCIELPIVVLIMLLPFFALRISRIATNLFALISILLGLLYIAVQLHFYEADFDYFAFIYCLLLVLMGILLLTSRFTERPSVSVKYIFSIVPIGYITILAVHKPYPIEANLTMLFAQMLILFLLSLPTQIPGRRYNIACKVLLLFIAIVFIIYFIIIIAVGAYLFAIPYSIYGIAVGWLGLKVSPYAPLFVSNSEEQH